MWLQNKKTGLKWFVANEDHRKRLLKTGDFEPVEAEEKENRKKQTRDGK